MRPLLRVPLLLLRAASWKRLEDPYFELAIRSNVYFVTSMQWPRITECSRSPPAKYTGKCCSELRSDAELSRESSLTQAGRSRTAAGLMLFARIRPINGCRAGLT